MNALLYKILGAILIITLAFGAGWKVKGWKDDSSYKALYADLINQINAEQQHNLTLSKQYAATLTQYHHMTEETQKHVKIEVDTHPIYLDCILPDSGLQLINAAVDEANHIKSAH